MKKTILILTVMALALAFAVTYVDAAEVSKDWPSNGITVFSTGVVALDDAAILPMQAHVDSDMYLEGSAAGGLREEKPLSNGVTYFEMTRPAGDEHPGKFIDNGITAF
ncbi:MAG TPA: hypothetical protein VL197_10025 [Nitrospirota bacterium]|nr:hypothetical protein [Nitrospirota bacterium]